MSTGDSTDKHGDAEKRAELVIDNTVPSKYDRRNGRREHVDDLGTQGR